MKQQKNIVGNRMQLFTRREYKQFIKHGPSWLYHYQRQTRRRQRTALIIGGCIIAALVEYLKHN